METFEETIRMATTVQVNKQVNKAVKEAIERAKIELDRKIPEIVAGLSLQFASHIRLETMQNEVVVHIIMKK